MTFSGMVVAWWYNVAKSRAYIVRKGFWGYCVKPKCVCFFLTPYPLTESTRSLAEHQTQTHKQQAANKQTKTQLTHKPATKQTSNPSKPTRINKGTDFQDSCAQQVRAKSNTPCQWDFTWYLVEMGWRGAKVAWQRFPRLRSTSAWHFQRRYQYELVNFARCRHISLARVVPMHELVNLVPDPTIDGAIHQGFALQADESLDPVPGTLGLPLTRQGFANSPRE